MPSLPRSVETIKEQLQELRDIMDRTRAFGVRDFASKMEIQSMVHEEALLVNELKAAYLLTSDTALQVAVTGAPIVDHRIDMKFLGSLLLHLQEFVNALGQVTEGRITQFGMLPKAVVRSNRLMVDSVMATSFGLNFTMADQYTVPLQPPLIEEDPIPDSIDALHIFFNGQAPLSDLTEVVAFPRVKRHYNQIMKLLEDNRGTMEIRTRHYPQAVYMAPDQASARSQWIRLIQSDITSIQIRGILTEGSVRLNKFEIETEDGKHYSGRSTEHATAWMKRIPLGTLVDAEILQSTTKHEQTDVDFRTDYLLRLLHPVTNKETAGSPRTAGA